MLNSDKNLQVSDTTKGDLAMLPGTKNNLNSILKRLDHRQEY